MMILRKIWRCKTLHLHPLMVFRNCVQSSHFSLTYSRKEDSAPNQVFFWGVRNGTFGRKNGTKFILKRKACKILEERASLFENQSFNLSQKTKSLTHLFNLQNYENVEKTPFPVGSAFCLPHHLQPSLLRHQRLRTSTLRRQSHSPHRSLHGIHLRARHV